MDRRPGERDSVRIPSIGVWAVASPGLGSPKFSSANEGLNRSQCFGWIPLDCFPIRFQCVRIACWTFEADSDDFEVCFAFTEKPIYGLQRSRAVGIAKHNDRDTIR